MSPEPRDEAFEKLLHFLRQSRGFDFTGYKRSTLTRRVRTRMNQLGIEVFAEYEEYLGLHAEEFALLFNTILINVTGYFRDPSAWEYLASEIVPRILANKMRHETIRAWSAGCSSGEEAFTVAILFAEALGLSEYRERVKVYATDVDEEALARARSGGTTQEDLKDVPAPLREKYFEGNGDRHVFRTDLRRSVIFGRHDLHQDAPISRLDLLVCRNTLMYFEAEAQGRILARMHYALNEKGALFLGRAEMLLTRDNLFTPLDIKHHVFSKVVKLNLRGRLVPAPAGSAEASDRLTRQLRLQEVIADALPVAQVVVDSGGNLAIANERARSMFSLAPADVGRPLQDLELSYRPLELRSRLEQAYRDRQPVAVRQVERPLTGGETQHLDIDIAPLVDNDDTLLGASITFVDVTRAHHVGVELERARQDLETATEELQSTNEELETTNEELQSTVEELETTNEELQSSNEELETMNEELESTNSELQTINAELHKQGGELDRMNIFMESILTSLRQGVAVLDADLHILHWNRKAEDLWGVVSSEVEGQGLLQLDIGLPVTDLAEPIGECLSGKARYREVSLASTNRRGKSIRCRVVCTPLGSQKAPPVGVVLLMEELEAAASTH
jgi:two-component system CheB/CheR fusion protein